MPGWLDWDIGQFITVSQHYSDRAAFADRASIFTIPKLGEKLKQDVTPLTYTPRKFVSYPYNNIFYTIETDHRTYAPAAIQRIMNEKVS